MRYLVPLAFALLTQAVVARDLEAPGLISPAPSKTRIRPLDVGAAAPVADCSPSVGTKDSPCTGELQAAKQTVPVRIRNDEGFPAHFSPGERWYERWGDSIIGGCQSAIGRVFERALKNDALAVAWYVRASHHGNPDAQYRLGSMYSQGRGGLRKDLAQASRLLHAAAEEGHVDAQGSLGLSYLLGQGVPQNFKYAYMWVSLASDVRGGASIRTKDLIAKAMPTGRLPEAEELARRCKDSAFLRCDAESWQ